MSDSLYAEFDGAAYTELRKDLLREKGSLRQHEFLGAVRHSDRFLDYLKDAIPIYDGDTMPLCEEELSEQVYMDPPQDIEEGLYRAWHMLTPRLACRPTFWAAVTMQHIEASRIRSSYLAANGGPTKTGAQRIDLALSNQDPKLVDGCVRTVIRRMSGLPEDRGNRSVYVNCPLARAWWRERMVARVLAHGGIVQRPMVLEVLRSNQEYWERLISVIVSRNSVLGSAVVLEAFVASLAKLSNAKPETHLLKAQQLVKAVRRLSTIAASRELGVLEFSDLVDLSWDVIWKQHQNTVP